jgi:hypothetical protein
MPGFLVTDGGGNVRCGLASFDADGTVNERDFCDGFAVLGH